MSFEAPEIHPTAIIDAPCAIGARTHIWHFCHVMKGAEIGEDCVLGQNVFVAGSAKIGARSRIQNNVSIYDGVELEAAVFVGPSVVFTNVARPRADFPRKDRFVKTLVREGASIGANATLRCGVTIGRYAFVAAGAVVTRSVPDFTLVMGVPAHPRGFVCRCGEALMESLCCSVCRRSYRLEPSGLRESPAG